MACPILGTKAKRGCRTRMPSMFSCAGTEASRPAVDQRPSVAAPGNHGIVASTSTSHKRESAANCWRLNGEDRGSTLFGKILVTIKTRICSDRSLNVGETHRPCIAQQLEAEQRHVVIV